jgi:hypothetical protein
MHRLLLELGLPRHSWYLLELGLFLNWLLELGLTWHLLLHHGLLLYGKGKHLNWGPSPGQSGARAGLPVDPLEKTIFQLGRSTGTT